MSIPTVSAPIHPAKRRAWQNLNNVTERAFSPADQGTNVLVGYPPIQKIQDETLLETRSTT